MKLTRVIPMHKNLLPIKNNMNNISFHVQGCTVDLGCVIDHAWKWLEVCLSCFIRFCPILWNFRTLCDAHVVYR